jgi:GT2 family glycosyltransferase/glycosyltransferase involved in cell wall biosynthesis
MSNQETLVGISILNYNSAEALAVTLDSLLRMKTDIHFICSVLDNASNDCEKARSLFAAFQKKKPEIAGEFIASPKNLGFSGGNNVLIRKFLSDMRISHIMLANSDLSFTDYSIDRMLSLGADAVGPVTGNAGNLQTIETDLGNISMSTNNLPKINAFAKERWHIFGDSIMEVPMLVFFCSLLSRNLVETVGELDERFYPGSYEDDDYCIRMKEFGYRMVCARGVFIYHWGSQSFSTLEFSKRKQCGDENRAKLENKWNKAFVSRVADPLISCRHDVEYLMKRQENRTSALIQQGFSTAEKLITDQNAAIEFYQRKMEEYESQANKHIQSNAVPYLEQIYQMTPIRRGVMQVPGRVLLKQLFFKLKRRIKMLFGIEYPIPVSKVYWNGYDLLYCSEALAQLIERIAFRISGPLHRRSEQKELRNRPVSATRLNEDSVQGEDNNQDNSLLCSISTLEQRISGGTRPAIAFLAPYPSEEFLRDGYYKRIRNIDDLFSTDYFRIYVSQYDNLISEPQVIEQNEHSVEILFNVVNEYHLRKIAKIVNKCAFLYTHSVLRINTLLLDQIHIPKILDVHGSVPEEAHLYKNLEGQRIYEEWEKYAVSTFDAFVCVTDAMRAHLEHKYTISLPKSIVLPTYDQGVFQYIMQEFKVPKKVSECTTVYSGGMQKWQRMDLVMNAMKKCGNMNYLLLTPDTDYVRDECIRNKITGSIQIKSVAPDAIAAEYKKCQYGFILRDDIVVNHVACPTKLMEYIAYGIIPIMYTPNIGDFVNIGMQYVPYDDFLAGKLPDEKARLAMVQHNLEVAKRLACIYEMGEKNILAFGRECLLRSNGFPPQNPDEKEAIGLVVGSFDKGGLEQAVFNLYEGYRARGHETYILCQNNIVGHFAGKLASPEHLCVFNDNAERFFDFCREKNIRWLHYHYNTFMIREARMKGLRTIYSLQNVYTWLSDKDIRARAELINSAHAVVAGSTFSKDYYCARTDTSKAAVSVIPIGVNTIDLDSHSMNSTVTRESLSIKPTEITLGFIASFHQVKHQMNMVGAMEQIIRKNPEIKLLFVANIGHPDYYQAVRTACEQSPAKDNIIFVPFIDHTQLGEFLRQTVDIFILPTIQEGCSNAVIDALYVGKPMLLTDVGNAGDLRHLESVTVVSRPYDDLLAFRQSDIDDLCLKKDCINTAEIAEGILSIAANLPTQKQAAERAALEYHDQCDNRYMSDCYLKIIEMP